MRRNFYITTRGVEVSRKGNSIAIGEQKFPISMIHTLFLFPGVKITEGARNLLLTNGRPIVFMSRGYKCYGILLPELYQSSTTLRLLQYQHREDLEFAKLLVQLKIESIQQVTGLSMEIQLLKVKEAYTFEQLLGMEGNVSNMMFKAFEKRLKGETGFKGSFKRSYNPPLDEINGLLSFLYTLYYSYLLPQLVVEGFDPYVGFLHRRRGRHAILVSDVMEEARPYLTFLAIPIYKEIYPEGFSSKLYLTPEGRKVALRHFEQFLERFEPRAVKELKKILLKKREWKSERVEQDEYASFCHRTKII